MVRALSLVIFRFDMYVSVIMKINMMASIIRYGICLLFIFMYRFVLNFFFIFSPNKTYSHCICLWVNNMSKKSTFFDFISNVYFLVFDFFV